MITKSDFENWLQGYLKAWKSNDPKDIEKHCSRRTPPTWPRRSANPGLGATIVKEWIGRADLANEPQDQWTFDYHWLAIEGETGVLDGVDDLYGAR